MVYHFFYDETEHSRKINYETVTANNYYDNFITAIVGWKSEDEKSIYEKYEEFEKKYDYRKQNGELKSQTMKSKDLRLGFASLNKHTIEFYEDLLSLYDEKVNIYFSVFSKIEYVINQLFMDYENSIFVDIDSMKYSIIKAIIVYRPLKVIKAIYKAPEEFVQELRLFFKERIRKNKLNLQLKRRENDAFEEILLLLDDVEPVESLNWCYYAPFSGFAKLLKELNISDYSLIIDREGDAHSTSNSAKVIGIKNVSEGDSKDYIGIRMSDMFVGLISRFMQSLKTSLAGNYENGKIEKTLLDTGWFALNERQFDLYKRLHEIVCINNQHWYNTYAGLYSDDLVAFVSLLQYISHFESVEELRNNNFNMHPEYFNSFVCEELQRHYNMMRNKLPINRIADDSEDYFYNRKGAKVYKDIERQPMLHIEEGNNRYNVLSVGFSKKGCPLLTISDDGEACCYRLPSDYGEWAMTVVGFANCGEKLFPAEVVFSLIDGRYYADIL